MGYVVWRITRPTARTPAGGAEGIGGRELEDARAHRARAEELARAGRYAEALAYRFVALVLELERRRALAFHPSKTPAEYVGEARLDAAGRASLAELVARLYRPLFGGVPRGEGGDREFGAAAGGLGGGGARRGRWRRDRALCGLGPGPCGAGPEGQPARGPARARAPPSGRRDRAEAGRAGGYPAPRRIVPAARRERRRHVARGARRSPGRAATALPRRRGWRPRRASTPRWR